MNKLILYDEEHLTPNDPNAEYEYDWFGIKPPFWIKDWRDYGWMDN